MLLLGSSLASLAGLAAAAASKSAPPPPPPTWPYFLAIAVAALAGGQLVKGLPDWVGNALGAAFAFSILEAVSASSIIPYPIVAGGHAAVTAILFATPPKTAIDTARAVLGGHVIAASMALALAHGLPEAAGFAIKTVIVTLAVGAQKAAGAVHPPACALAFMWATSAETSPYKLIGPLIGCSVLIVCQQAWVALGKEAKAEKAKKK